MSGRRRIVWLSLLLLAVGIGLAQTKEEDGWVPLFDGRTLKGWSVHSGFAKYTAEDGTIVGTAVKGSPNSFLCTNKEYGDYILEFEVQCDPELNSGVQFRSHIAKTEMPFVFHDDKGQPRVHTIPTDRVYGYQVEIATAKSRSSGGIYDEARRAFFLADIRNNPAAQEAFKDGQWNKYRIECRGYTTKTSINGVPCVELKDSLDTKGVIGLQVHGLGENFQPYQVRWRNLRIREL
jgi:hypothetical protein